MAPYSKGGIQIPAIPVEDIDVEEILVVPDDKGFIPERDQASGMFKLNYFGHALGYYDENAYKSQKWALVRFDPYQEIDPDGCIVYGNWKNGGEGAVLLGEDSNAGEIIKEFKNANRQDTIWKVWWEEVNFENQHHLERLRKILFGPDRIYYNVSTACTEDVRDLYEAKLRRKNFLRWLVKEHEGRDSLLPELVNSDSESE